jgi:hypothetical protein
MENKKPQTIPLISLDRFGRFRISDDGRQWIIEEGSHNGWSSQIELDGSFYNCCGTDLMDMIHGIRELEIRVDMHGRKSLAAFWNEYKEYSLERSTKTTLQLFRDLNSLIYHAEPIDTAMIMSDSQILSIVDRRRRQTKMRRQMVYGSSRRHFRVSEDVLKYNGCQTAAMVKGRRSG